MASWVFALSKVMGNMSKYLVYVDNFGWRNDKSRRSYESFGNICSKIEFVESCSGKLFISLIRVIIPITKIEDM